MTTRSTSVLVVGAGPAGLMTALLLARSGVSVLVAERHQGTSIHPRARGLNVRTMEIFRSLGLETAVQEAGAALRESRYMLFVESLAGREIRRVLDDDLVPTGSQLESVTPCNWSQCAQDELEPILARDASAHGATLLFHTELVSFVQDESGVDAILLNRDTGDQMTVHADYLVAADGASSPVRDMLSLPLHGQATLDHFINIYFRADLSDLVRDRWFGICFVENSEVEGLFLAVNNTDRWLFNVSYDPSTGAAPEDFTLARCIELLRAAVGLPNLQPEILSMLPWTASARIVDHFQQGRVFLLGDAAHTMPPAGGFGLNTAVQDAHNLAWKLALVLQGKAHSRLLTTYEAERLPVADTIVAQAVADISAPTPDTPAYGPPEGNEDEGSYQPGDVLSYVLGYQYNSQAVLISEPLAIDEPGLHLDGRPGTRAPHVWLERNGERISSLDLFTDHCVLLTGSSGSPWIEAAHDVSKALSYDLHAYSIGPDGDLLDLDKRWAATNGVSDEGAVLVRPDGFVAWRSERLTATPQQTLAHVMRQLLGFV